MGESHLVKVADFGLARLMKEDTYTAHAGTYDTYTDDTYTAYAGTDEFRNNENAGHESLDLTKYLGYLEGRPLHV